MADVIDCLPCLCLCQCRSSTICVSFVVLCLLVKSHFHPEYWSSSPPRITGYDHGKGGGQGAVKVTFAPWQGRRLKMAVKAVKELESC
eukprot:102901-Hanusia_phi.AAC.1